MRTDPSDNGGCPAQPTCLAAFGARLPDPFASCAGAGSHLSRLSVPRFL